ncbi:hypothetical protein SAMN04488029_3147 [Reichenbachiella faecimaris]|uniref:Lipocalin-like domain-containing protein n=1 Tax=Reichenbachiella faecimaris TaxID=692418 RepID=A0A1W2GK45_REIFA|nr:hypothetical protein [Reichenbachiella faecimaris]SMD36924.1 hypothetical protein SAMN04488029_3147 [Reichenbachiella faecimaris]
MTDKLHVLVLFFILIFLTSGCQDEDQPSILGVWSCSEGYLENCGESSIFYDLECEGFEVTFLSDGTFATAIEFNGEIIESEGTYIISDDFLILNLETGNEATDRFTLSSSELQIINEQGEGCQLIWVYTKV